MHVYFNKGDKGSILTLAWLPNELSNWMFISKLNFSIARGGGVITKRLLLLGGVSYACLWDRIYINECDPFSAVLLPDKLRSMQTFSMFFVLLHWYRGERQLLYVLNKICLIRCFLFFPSEARWKLCNLNSRKGAPGLYPKLFFILAFCAVVPCMAV